MQYNYDTIQLILMMEPGCGESGRLQNRRVWVRLYCCLEYFPLGTRDYVGLKMESEDRLWNSLMESAKIYKFGLVYVIEYVHVF